MRATGTGERPRARGTRAPGQGYNIESSKEEEKRKREGGVEVEEHKKGGGMCEKKREKRKKRKKEIGEIEERKRERGHLSLLVAISERSPERTKEARKERREEEKKRGRVGLE